MRKGPNAAAAILVAALAAIPAAGPAFTLGGAITGGSGSGAFVKLDPSRPFAVGQDTFETDHLYAFDEDQNILLEADLVVDIGAEGRIIPKGTTVASHYVFFDPAYGTTQRGYVAFDATVLGIATSQSTLAASDFLANTAVTYLNPALRGLEWEDHVWIDRENPFRIQVNWAASTPGDYIRIFTARSPGV
ncbi:MAG: hypothetical protein AAF074_05005 [Pseudomonadota bacterium]